MAPAFAASTAVLSAPTSTRAALTSRHAPTPPRAARRASRAAAPTMSEGPMPPTPMRSGPRSTGRDAPVSVTTEVRTQKYGLDLPGRQIPQGFTEYSEQLNGRVTMVSFVAAVAAEVLNPAHPTIVQQVGFVMSPINNFLQSIL